MADFCKQCTESIFGKGHTNDLIGLITKEQVDAGYVSSVMICEGCGPIQVNHLGECVSPDCDEHHGKEP